MGETDWEGKLGLVLMGRAMLSKCLIPFSIDGWGCIPFLLFTWGQTMVEVMKIMVTSFKRSQACTTILNASDPAAGHHRLTPPPETPRHSWQVWVSLLWVTAPFSWVSVHKLLLCPLRVRSPVLCKFWGLSGGLMATSSKSTYATPRSAAPRAPGPAAGHCWPAPPQETLTHGSVSVSVGPPGPGVHTACLSLWAPLVGMGFDSKCDFAPPTVLLGLFPWTWGVSSQLPQCHTAAQRSNCQHLLDHWQSKRVPEKHLLLLYWLCQSLCVDHNEDPTYLKRPWCWKDWRREEKGMTEDEMVGWHHLHDGHAFDMSMGVWHDGHALGVGDSQRSLECCSPWGHKELDTAERLNWTELKLHHDGKVHRALLPLLCGHHKQKLTFQNGHPTLFRMSNFHINSHNTCYFKHP